MPPREDEELDSMQINMERILQHKLQTPIPQKKTQRNGLYQVKLEF